MESIIEIPENAASDQKTLADSGFEWREKDGVRVLVCRPLEHAGFVNGFSTRAGGVSPFPENDLNLAGFDEDNAENIAENRRRFLSVLGVSLPIATVWQIHSSDVETIAEPSDVAEAAVKADAMISDLKGILAGVKTADCVPVLLGDPSTGAYAAVHAGWRGTAGLITEKAVQKLVETFNVQPADLIAAIGPAACGSDYEVGADVIEAFDANVPDGRKYFHPTREGHAFADIISANRDQLLRCGVRAENIYTAPYCTLSDTHLFFSYRIEKKKFGKTGRSLSVIGRT